MNPRDAIEAALGSLQQAMLDDTRWPAAAARIDEACGLAGNSLAVGATSGDDECVYYAGFYSRGERRHDLEREYFEFYYPRDERLPRLRSAPAGKLLHVPDLYDQRERRTSAVYNEALPRFGNQNGLNVRFDGPDGLRIVWASGDPAASGGWRSSQLDRIVYLLPHIHHFVRVRQALSAAGALGAGLAGLLDSGRIGVIQLDRQGRILEANPRALAVLRRGDGLSDKDGALHAWLPEDTGRLRRLLRRALPALWGEPPAGGSMTLRRPAGQARLSLHVSPVGGAAFLGAGPVSALVLVVDPAGRPRVNAARVATVLGLTASEGYASALLAEGRSVRDIAAAAGWQENYVRWLLKQVYKKQGVSGQAALVGLVLAADSLPRR